MNQFASGRETQLLREGRRDRLPAASRGERTGRTDPVFGANVQLLIYGDAFWPTYTTGDNTDLVATDSMKNFIQRETMNFAGDDLESYCRFLGEKFLNTYPQAEGAQVSLRRRSLMRQIWRTVRLRSLRRGPIAPSRAWNYEREGSMEMRSGIQGFKLLRLGGSAFYGFVRDQYTTLPEIRNRPLHMWLDLDWSYVSPGGRVQQGRCHRPGARTSCMKCSTAFESGSIQQIIYQIGNAHAGRTSRRSAEVRLEANNRTWDTIAEQGMISGFTPMRGRRMDAWV